MGSEPAVEANQTMPPLPHPGYDRVWRSVTSKIQSDYKFHKFQFQIPISKFFSCLQVPHNFIKLFFVTMQFKTYLTFLCLLASTKAFPRAFGTRRSVTSLNDANIFIASLNDANLFLAQSPTDIVNTIIPLTITASAFWSTVTKSSDPSDLTWFEATKVSAGDETPVATPVEEVAAPVLEVAVVEEKIEKESCPEVAVPVMAAVAVEETPTAAKIEEETAVETPKILRPVLKSLSNEKESCPEVAVPVMAAVAVEETPTAAKIEEETAVETPKTRRPVLKSLSKFLRFLSVPWIEMVPKFSKTS
jgi:hypothetical protein